MNAKRLLNKKKVKWTNTHKKRLLHKTTTKETIHVVLAKLHKIHTQIKLAIQRAREGSNNHYTTETSSLWFWLKCWIRFAQIHTIANSVKQTSSDHWKLNAKISWKPTNMCLIDLLTRGFSICVSFYMRKMVYMRRMWFAAYNAHKGHPASSSILNMLRFSNISYMCCTLLRGRVSSLL